MKQIEAELKKRQLVLLQQALFQDVLTDRLLHLWREIPEARCYAISPELMEHAEQSLKALAKGSHNNSPVLERRSIPSDSVAET